MNVVDAVFSISYDSDDVLTWPCSVDLDEKRIIEFGEQDSGIPFNDVPSWAMETSVTVNFGGYEADAIKDDEYNDDPDGIDNAYGDEVFYLFDDEDLPVD